MNVTSKNLPDSKVELTVELNKDDLIFYVKETEERLAKDSVLGGFRPGKVPKDVLRKKIGEDKIKEEALQTAIQSSLEEALAKEKLDVIDRVDFGIKENSADRLVYKVAFTVFPGTELGEYKGLDIKKNEPSVNEEEISKIMQDLQKSRMVLSEVQRPATKGDRVEIDFAIKDKGAVIEGGESVNHPVILGDNLFVPGFEDQIVGMSSGDRKSFSLKIPADYYQKKIAGKELDFEVTLKKVEKRILPELNDEFAKSLGRFNSLEEVENNIKLGLMEEKTAKEKERVRLAILGKIGEKTKVKIPEILVERRLDEMISGLDNELHQKGMELGPYLAHLQKTQNDLRKEWRDRAESQVKMSLIVRAIAKEENLAPNDDEIDSEFKAVLEQYLVANQDGGEEALKNLNPDELRSRIKSMLTNEKVFNFLEEHNTV